MRRFEKGRKPLRPIIPGTFFIIHFRKSQWLRNSRFAAATPPFNAIA